MELITIWERKVYDKNRIWKWKHNHIEKGWLSLITPTPNCEYQKRSWSKAKWRGDYAYIIEDNKVVYGSDIFK